MQLRQRRRAGVRPSTVTRWVQSGKLPAQRLASGTLQIAEADLAAFLPLRDAAPRAMPADATVALAVAQERIRGLEELVALEREWRTMAEERLALVQTLAPCRRHVQEQPLPAAPVVLALGEGLGPPPRSSPQDDVGQAWPIMATGAPRSELSSGQGWEWDLVAGDVTPSGGDAR